MILLLLAHLQVKTGSVGFIHDGSSMFESRKLEENKSLSGERCELKGPMLNVNQKHHKAPGSQLWTPADLTHLGNINWQLYS